MDLTNYKISVLIKQYTKGLLMEFANEFPSSYQVLKPFRADFGQNVPTIYKQASWKGRVYCFIQLISSPATVAFKVGRKVGAVASLVASVAGLSFYLITKCLGRIWKRKPIEQQAVSNEASNIKKLALYALDLSIAVALSPIGILASRVRYLIGIIYPPLAFSPSFLVIKI
ncbi:Uncharacterized protein NEOC95_002037 [Neochlamydia sp. AcF95]|nr:Uncharacterized protein [Neochlamydia sp. AcF95]